MTKNDSIASMIAKVELNKEIAQIALACPDCNGPVRNAINRFKDRNQNDHQGGGRSSFAAMNDKKDCITDDFTLEYK